MIFKRKVENHLVPGLNTASLPDLIFTVLFFFMIVTNMRQDDVRVRIIEPNGQELTQMQRKNFVTNIYIGKLIKKDNIQIQIDNTFMRSEEITIYMKQKMKGMKTEDITKMIVNIKADRNTPMSIIKQIKESLRRAGTLKIHYSANEIKDDHKRLH